jgi:hypothetical protein
MTKVYWASRHSLLLGQKDVIKKLHGEVEILEEKIIFDTARGLSDYIAARNDGIVYAVAGGVHYLYAALEGKDFYIFELDPVRRDSFRALYHVYPQLLDGYSMVPRIMKVWGNEFQVV